MSTQNTNRLIESLSAQARHLLLSQAVEVGLPLHASLYEAEQTPSHAYFMTSGMASIVTGMEDGDSAEVGIVGREGLVGGLHVLGPAKVYTSGFIQLEATALKMPLSHLRMAFRTSEEIRDRILEFYQEQSLVISQLAACNRLHEAEERLARWLLMAADRTQSEVLNLTQEFLGMMLGSRRTTVTLIAGSLQRAGLIEYSRGRVKILHRENLESAACGCYHITKKLLADLYAQPSPAQPSPAQPSPAHGTERLTSASSRP